MADEVIDADDRLLETPREPLGELDADEERSREPGATGDGDPGEVLRRDSGARRALR